MQIDDRLATVLRTRTGGEAQTRTQFRQLVDLLGTLPSAARGPQIDAAWVKLADLAKAIPVADRVQAVSAAGLRLRSPRLVAELVRSEPQVAAAALQSAQLGEEEWLDLIPALPPKVRPLLRLRSDLGERVEALLDRLGIARQALPPAGRASRHAANDTQGAIAEEAREGIGAIVRRIEAYRARKAPLPADDSSESAVASHLDSIAFTCDERGIINWADPSAAPALAGMKLAARDKSSGIHSQADLAAAFTRRAPLRDLALDIAGAPAVSGKWRIDAFPRFDALGRFTGYDGRLRRPCPPEMMAASPDEGEGDRLRQLLHELRTPINAIQGFAEVIQQQLFGPTPHEYRAHAAAIAGDAARMLAGFDDLERLAKLATGAMTIEEGQSDLAACVLDLARQLEGHMAARSSGFALATQAPSLVVCIAREEVERLVWRLLATLAAATAPGERLALILERDDALAVLKVQLPKALADQVDIFHAYTPPSSSPLSAGMFGAGFALRLAANEARAADGKLERAADFLHLEVPLVASDLTSLADTGSKGLTG
ncbi:MAG: histidine kinase dimerization/phospho-acceptor domain-containing protein [Novosphingobium sp.]